VKLVQRRWEGDSRGRGAADARFFAVGLAELADATGQAAWVAEELELHLLPHLRRACDTLPLELESAATAADGTFEIDLRWTGEQRAVGKRREAVFALLGSVAETSSYVRQRDSDSGELLFEVVTGMLEADTSFAPHGHTLRMLVR
jgi:hypothetical protein